MISNVWFPAFRFRQNAWNLFYERHWKGKRMNLDLHLTTACNMKCTFCGAWEYGKKQAWIDTDEAKRTLETGKRLGYRITTFTGGEPSLHPQFCKILEYAHQLGYWTVVTTNGLELTREMVETYRKCRTLVRVSFHTLKADLHGELTGTDTLQTVTENVKTLRSNGVRLGLGCTIFDANLDEVENLCQYAWEAGTEFIRFTPVVGMRGAEHIKLEYDFYLKLLTRISRICVDNSVYLPQCKQSDDFCQNIMEYMLTRRCAGGSSQHIIYDCHGNLLPCSFLPESANLCSFAEDGSPEERFRQVYEKVDAYFSEDVAAQLKGECGICQYKKSCLGGCLTMKIPFQLDITEEQPVCMKKIIGQIQGVLSPEERKSLNRYWSECFLRKTAGKDQDKVCVRRLPIWEINFRYGIDRKNKKLKLRSGT